jgi:hypothetical protein
LCLKTAFRRSHEDPQRAQRGPTRESLNHNGHNEHKGLKTERARRGHGEGRESFGTTMGTTSTKVSGTLFVERCWCPSVFVGRSRPKREFVERRRTVDRTGELAQIARVAETEPRLRLTEPWPPGSGVTEPRPPGSGITEPASYRDDRKGAVLRSHDGHARERSLSCLITSPTTAHACTQPN